MRSVLPLAFAGCLLVPATPLMAHEGSTPGPIARAVSREAARLASTGQSSTLDIRWARVGRLAAASEIRLIARGSEGKRYFIAADAATLTVLNVTHLDIPAGMVRMLQNAIVNHADYFAGPRADRTLVVGYLRLTPHGVFAADRKLAELRDVIEVVDRADVREIRADRAFGSPGGAVAGAVIGGLLGTAAALGAGFSHCGNDCGATRAFMYVAPIAFPVGLGLAGYYGFRRTIDSLIYAA